MENNISLTISVLTLLGVLGSAYLSRRTSRPDALSIQEKTLTEAFESIRKLREQIRTAEDDVDRLRKDIRKLSNGYDKALKFIREKHPGEEIPDFLKDSDPKIRAIKP